MRRRGFVGGRVLFAAVVSLAMGAGTAGAVPGEGGLEIRLLDAAGAPVAGPSARASVERTPPATEDASDPDALRLLIVAPRGELPLSLDVASFPPGAVAGEDAPMDSLPSFALSAEPCPDGIGVDRSCGISAPLRAVMDEVDREHPLVASRSIRVALGGTLVATAPHGGPSITIPVGAPRSLAIDATLSARLRVKMVRLDPGGAPPIGKDDADAADRVRGEIERAAMIWSQCGVDFGDPSAVDIEVVDPPPPHLLAIGCDAAAPASGGELRFEVDGKLVDVPLPPGTSARGAARLAAKALRVAGFMATIYDGAPGLATTYGASDLSVRRANGTLATLATPPGAAPDGGEIEPGHASTDSTLDACIGSVFLGDGFEHFSDANAAQGSLEERTLLRAFDDGDPRTIEVYVVPSFAAPNRIGESFIFADAGSIRNVVVEDRAGFRSDRASFTLAHELGHVLLDDPGHPDDYDGDTPTRLMDADAVDGTAFGPRRLELDECARAFAASGPRSGVPLLAPRAPASAAKKKPAVSAAPSRSPSGRP